MSMNHHSLMNSITVSNWYQATYSIRVVSDKNQKSPSSKMTDDNEYSLENFIKQYLFISPQLLKKGLAQSLNYFSILYVTNKYYKPKAAGINYLFSI